MLNAAAMAALISAQQAFLFLWISGSLAAESLRENVTSGEDVLLQCNSSTDAAITKLEWSRPVLEEDYVFFFRGNRQYERYQDPRYRGRVQLSDPEMKNGNVSVVLKNVNINDTGTYECRVITPQTRRKRAADEKLVSSVLLTVSKGPEKETNDEHPGGSRGHVGLGVGVGVVCLVGLVGVGVGVGLFLKLKEHRNRDQPTDEQEMSELNTRPSSIPCSPLLNAHLVVVVEGLDE